MRNLKSNLVFNYNIDNLSNYKLNIASSGIYYLTFYYNNINEKNVFINVESNLDVVIIEYHDGDKLFEKTSINVNINIKINSKVKLISNVFNDKLNLNYNGEINVYNNSNLETVSIYLGNCNSNYKINLLEEGATVESNLRSFVDIDYSQNHDVYINHLSRDTFSNMVNYAVLSDLGKININASSLITEGSKKSEAYQKSKVFSLSEKTKSNINPILKIHENDVKASHAATSGKMNYLDLYYLKSRGLSVNDINKMLTIGLLSKDLDDELIKELTFVIERRLENV